MRRLHQADYDAYLVGGAVRDLLLGGHPKDFDVATNATPEQVKSLFSNGRIIGRRFQIVHVRFGREIIEVTTFRGGHENAKTNKQQSTQSKSGMLLRDNVYGTLEEDAIRRDLTINALYYDSRDFTVHDFADGLNHLEQRLICVIGEPETRYREDPVRMLRVLRFAAKLEFDLTEDCAEPIERLGHLIKDVPAARMFDEVLKLMMAGYGIHCFDLLREYKLFSMLFPQTNDTIESGDKAGLLLLEQGLINTDDRIQAGKPVTPAYLFAVLLWPPVREMWQQLKSEGVPDIPALHQAAQIVLERQQQQISIPKRFSMPMRDIWEMQYRLTQRQGRRGYAALEHRYFRAGYDFLLLREDAGELKPGLGDWWTSFQQADTDEQAAMINQLPKTGGQGPRRNRRKKAS